ncbi:MAG: ATP-binding protein [Thermodesulfobacteriota bacterium]
MEKSKKESTKVLLIEDNPGDARLIKESLKEVRETAYEIETAERLTTGLELLTRGGIDCLLLDLNLPDSQGIDTCVKVHSHAPQIPIVVLTGLDDEATASMAVRGGAQDYLPKGSLESNLLNRSLRYAIERQKARGALEKKNGELTQMTQQLWQTAKLATLGELAASIAHELNNPLATISLRIELLKTQLPPDSPQQKGLEIVEQEIERMSNLVSSLLEFGRRGERHFSSVDLREELEKTIELVKFHLSKQNIRVQKEFFPGLPLVQADRQQLRQIFLNLMTNACDAMANGGTLTIRTNLQKKENQESKVAIEFADTGVGIPPEDLSNVTEPFFTKKASGKGTGLGLAICKRIVQDHKGDLEITSQLGQGTVVRLILPVIGNANGQYLRETED